MANFVANPVTCPVPDSGYDHQNVGLKFEYHDDAGKPVLVYSNSVVFWRKSAVPTQGLSNTATQIALFRSRVEWLRRIRGAAVGTWSNPVTVTGTALITAPVGQVITAAAIQVSNDVVPPLREGEAPYIQGIGFCSFDIEPIQRIEFYKFLAIPKRRGCSFLNVYTKSTTEVTVRLRLIPKELPFFYSPTGVSWLPWDYPNYQA